MHFFSLIQARQLICPLAGTTTAQEAENAEVVAALRNCDAAGARLSMWRHFNRLTEPMLEQRGGNGTRTPRRALLLDHGHLLADA